MTVPRRRSHREGYHWFRGWHGPSAAQRRVLDELLLGGSTAEIAARLGLTEGGVKWHLDELREELELPDRPALTEWWRTQRRSAAFLPLHLLWRLKLAVANAPAVLLPVALVTLVVVGLAIATLGDDKAQSESTVPGAPGVVALLPTPTPAAVVAGAVVLDAEARTVTAMPGFFTARRWLDTRSDTFTASGPNGPVVIDAMGRSSPILEPPEPWGSAIAVPLVDRGQVMLWRDGQGLLGVLDSATFAETDASDYGPSVSGDRTWAISATTGALALTAERGGVLRTYDLQGAQLATFRPASDEAVMHIVWSPDGQRLLVLLGPRLDGNRVGSSQRFVVLDADGAQTFEGRIAARWAGSDTVLVTEADRRPAGGGALNGTILLDIATGTELPLSNPTSLLCASPDSLYGVFTYEEPAAGSQTVVQRQELRRLSTGELILTSRTQQYFFNCDWTPDSRRVVLSPGAK